MDKSAAVAVSERIDKAVRGDRLLDIAKRLCSVHSPTGRAGPAAKILHDILREEGFDVQRPHGGHPDCPAVVARLVGAEKGRTLEFNGHLDTVHLPFVPPQVTGDRLTGSGSSDMKAGIAAAVEAMLALRDAGLQSDGQVLLVAMDLHESPWGDGSQLNRLIADGVVGDAVLIPEYLNHCVAIVGRGALIWKARVRRPGAPIHEVMRPNEPSVIAAGAELARRLTELDGRLAVIRDPLAGCESAFIGQIHAGEIYNQYPQECMLEGTRRWLPDTSREAVVRELTAIFDEVAQATNTTIERTFHPIRDGFRLQDESFIECFQTARETSGQNRLPIGAKPFCDDGNSFWSIAKAPAITHGPNAGGAHTLEEWVSIPDLGRVARLYALTAVMFCREAA